MTVKQAAEKAFDTIEKIAQDVASRIESFEEAYREENPDEFK